MDGWCHRRHHLAFVISVFVIVMVGRSLSGKKIKLIIQEGLSMVTLKGYRQQAINCRLITCNDDDNVLITASPVISLHSSSQLHQQQQLNIKEVKKVVMRPMMRNKKMCSRIITTRLNLFPEHCIDFPQNFHSHHRRQWQQHSHGQQKQRRWLQSLKPWTRA